MTRIERSVTIDVPPERIFQELTSWDGLRRWSAITVDHTGPSRCSGVGDAFAQTIRLAGFLDLRTDWEVTAYDPPRSVAYRATGPGGGRLRMRQDVEPAGDGGRLHLDVEYDLPGRAFGAVVDRLYARRRIRTDVERTLENLRGLLERRRR
ncbi:MAG: SRPBCC family protein [Actinobacteria bacterium]|nr:SRPBCC family protein [Actinomycetota bacterium]